MTRTSVQKNSDMLGMVMIAAAVGAAVGMLVAPRKGSETRAGIRRRINDAKLRTQETAETVADKAVETVDKVKGRTNDTLDTAKDAALQARAQVEDIAAETQARQRARRAGEKPL